MNSKQDIADLLQTQLLEIKDHKQQCKDKTCQISIEVLQSVVDCIIEDLLEENREWTQNDINDWKSTLDQQGLCLNALEIFQFILDCLYKSKSLTQIQDKKQKEQKKSDIQDSSSIINNKYDLQMDNFFQTQIDDCQSSEIQRKKEIQLKIKALEESIQAKQKVIQETEEQLYQKQEEQYKESMNEEGWLQFEKEKILFLKEKSEILNKLEDIFLEIDAIQELVDIRSEIQKYIEDYDYNKILTLQQDLDIRLKNYSFIIGDIRNILQQMEKWEQKYPLCTDKSVNLFIEIEKDNQYLNSMLKQVNHVYSDQMLKELEGLHDVLSELEEIRKKNSKQ